MGTSKAEGKRSMKEIEEEEEEEENEDEDVFINELGSGESDEKRKKGYGRKGTAYCQVKICAADMTNAKPYHKRHKVCEFHAKASVVDVAGLPQRFCQQCSRFHEVSEFDDTKRSCRRRLAGHNERRRKSSSAENQGEGFSYSNVLGRPM